MGWKFLNPNFATQNSNSLNCFKWGCWKTGMPHCAKKRQLQHHTLLACLYQMQHYSQAQIFFSNPLNRQYYKFWKLDHITNRMQLLSKHLIQSTNIRKNKHYYSLW
jgi:hypothetical protein